ncbi:MAG: Uma2 family endonuclease [Gemmataceae bacterium]
MTSQQLFSKRPSPTVDRWLFRGELKECLVTKRNPNHSHTLHIVSFLLELWLRTQSEPRGRIYSGEAYFRLRVDPETNVGIDVALATAEQVAATEKKSRFVDGPPHLAVEILSPFDKQIDIHEAIEEYLDCGVKAVWIVDPYSETVEIHRLGKPPELLNRANAIESQVELPGFRCTVAELFM